MGDINPSSLDAVFAVAGGVDGVRGVESDIP